MLPIHHIIAFLAQDTRQMKHQNAFLAHCTKQYQHFALSDYKEDEEKLYFLNCICYVIGSI